MSFHRLRTFFLPLLLLIAANSLDAEPRLELVPIAEGLDQPLYVTQPGDGTERLFVVEKGGRIKIVRDGELLSAPFLDISDQVTNVSEMGLLGLAFHPSFAESGRFYVNYATQESGPRQTLISEFRVSPTDPDRADPGSEKVLLSFDQPFQNHNAGMGEFGPDGFLYIATGDGGGAGDPRNNGQDRSTLLGSILRIDVDGNGGYEIPSGNPFLGTEGMRGEIWAYGFRNPWRFSFDRETGLLFAGDVGQSNWEEIDIVRSGKNYGWNRMEGTHCYPSGSSCDRSGLELPVAEYSHVEGNSVTGGYVYRGVQVTEMQGAYIFGDFGSGRIWYLKRDQGGRWVRRFLQDTDLRIVSFGEDSTGELYLLDFGGALFRLEFDADQIVAQVADGHIPQGAFRSRILLVNPHDVPVTAEIELFSSSGERVEVGWKEEGRNPSDPFTLEPRSTLSFETSGVSDPVFSGWARVKSDRSVEVTSLYSLRDAAGRVTAEAGVASEPSEKSLIARIPTGGLSAARALALVNPGDFPTAVTLSISGNERNESREFQLPPGEKRARFLNEWFEGLPSDFGGDLTVSADQPIAATLLRTRNGLPLSSLPLAALVSED